jgi:3-hydroxybutyryl-CoA dehydrogenase
MDNEHRATPGAPERKMVGIGAGTMGSGVAMLFAAGGWNVQLVEPDAATRAALPGRLREGLMRTGAGGEKAARIRVLASLADVHWEGVELVSESAPEDLAVKRAIFAELEKLAPPTVILTSNSSSHPIGEIGEGLRTPRRMLGLHFLMPAQFVPIVEVICSEQSDPGLGDRVMGIMRALGKQPVRLNRDLPGFLVNRIQAALMREAIDLIDKGIASPEDIDAAVHYGFGFRYAVCGPILQKEHSGWEITTNLYKRVFPTLCNADGPAPVLRKMMEEHRYGMKTGAGFMHWEPESIARERERYENALRALLELMQGDAATPSGGSK